MDLGLAFTAETLEAVNELKARKHKFVVYKLSDDEKSIVVADKSSEKDWEVFRTQLVEAEHINKRGDKKKGCRFAVYDFEYQLEDGGLRQTAAFISWIPDSGTDMRVRTILAGAKERFKMHLGLVCDIPAHGDDDIEWDSVLEKVKSFKKY